jgi:hypothetical protein
MSESGFPLLTPNVPFQGFMRDGLEYKFLDCIQDREV